MLPADERESREHQHPTEKYDPLGWARLLVVATASPVEGMASGNGIGVTAQVQKNIRLAMSNIIHNMKPTLLVLSLTLPGHQRIAPNDVGARVC
jgi:hypothetical protein